MGRPVIGLYTNDMFRSRVLGKTPARPLASSRRLNDEAAGPTEAIGFSHSTVASIRVVTTKLKSRTR